MSDRNIWQSSLKVANFVVKDFMHPAVWSATQCTLDFRHEIITACCHSISTRVTWSAAIDLMFTGVSVSQSALFDSTAAHPIELSKICCKVVISALFNKPMTTYFIVGVPKCQAWVYGHTYNVMHYEMYSPIRKTLNRFWRQTAAVCRLNGWKYLKG